MSKKPSFDDLASTSSVASQRLLRIQKMEGLREIGQDPYTPYSVRDFSLGFVKFWFDFLHNYEFDEDEADYSLVYFLEYVIFPQSLLEHMEEKISFRHSIRELGMDPDSEGNNFEEEFDQNEIQSARKFFPTLAMTSEEKRLEYLKSLFIGYDEYQEDFTGTAVEGELKMRLRKYDTVTLCGRIKSKRLAGKIAFATIEDEECPEGFQFVFRKNILDESLEIEEDLLTFDDFQKYFDEGDYIQATGRLDYTKKGEPSLFVEKFKILTKALRPLPSKIDYNNFEYRYLNRVEDLKFNTKDENGQSIRDIIRLKSKYWQIWREEMLKEGFLEVECPVFEDIPGGANAKPFTTHYNELNQEMYLRISLELPLKMLIAGGFEKVFEIGRIFRNEGASPHHLQEYTQIEWYWSYSDYTQAMDLISRIYKRIVKELVGGFIQTDYYGKQINWGEWCSLNDAKRNDWKLINGWPAIKYYDAIRYFSHGEVDLENKTYQELLDIAKTHKVEIEKNISIDNLIDKIYKKKVRPNIQNPIFLYHQPVELEPLAKRDPEDRKFVHRWQIVAGGAELGKAFSELNDPIDQYERMKEQQQARDSGDEEAQFMNQDYIKAMELGMPPMSGFGMSERLVSFLLGKHIKECVTFPHVRRQQEPTKKPKTMVAHAIILDTPEIPNWSKMNAAAHLSASLAARKGKELIEIDISTSQDGVEIPMNIRHAIIMKRTDSAQELRNIKYLAEQQGLMVTVFTEEMRDSSDDLQVNLKHSQKVNENIGYLGILLYGKKSQVEELTEDFEKWD